MAPPKHTLVQHVNLQLDSFIANTDHHDLRAIVRNLLATEPSTMTKKFISLSQDRVKRFRIGKPLPHQAQLFTRVWHNDDDDASSTTGSSASSVSLSPPETRSSSPDGITKLPALYPSVGPSSYYNSPSSINNFSLPSAENPYEPSQLFFDQIYRARSIFGCGLGIESLPILTNLVRASIGIQYTYDSKVEDALAMLDADLAQAIQSCKDQYGMAMVRLFSGSDGSDEYDMDGAREIFMDLRLALNEAKASVETWEGEFVLERAVLSSFDWKALC